MGRSRVRKEQSRLLGFDGGWAPGWVRGNAPEKGAKPRPQQWAKARSANG